MCLARMLHILAGLSVALQLAACHPVKSGDNLDAAAVDASADANTGPFIVASQQKGPAGIAVSDSGIYFANRDAGTIVRCPLDGCNGSAPEVLVKDQTGPISVTVDDTYLYWVTGWHDGESGMPASRPVFRCPLADCTPANTVAFDQASLQPWGVRVIANTIFMAAWPDMAACPTSGCTDPTADFERGPALDINHDDKNYYSALFGWGQLQSCDFPDCSTPVTLLDSIAPTAVVVDDTNSTLYLTDYNFNGDPTHPPRILACPRDGCDSTTVSVVADGPISPYGLAQHGNRLYYTNLEQGTVISIPKP